MVAAIAPLAFMGYGARMDEPSFPPNPQPGPKPGPVSGRRALEAAFFGLWAVRANARLFGAICVLQAIAAYWALPDVLAYFQGLDAVLREIFQASEAAQAAGSTDLEAFLDRQAYDAANGALTQRGWALFDDMLVSFAIGVVGVAGVLRALVRGTGGRGLFGLWLGRDELNVLLVNLVVIGIGVGVVIVGGVVASMVAPLFVILLMVCALVWLNVRLVPAAAASIGEGRLALREGWAVSRSRAWVIVGLALLNGVALVVAALVVTSVTGGFIAAGVMAGVDPDAADAGVATLPLVSRVGSAISQGVMNALGVFAFAGIGAYVYRRWGPGLGLAGARPLD